MVSKRQIRLKRIAMNEEKIAANEERRVKAEQWKALLTAAPVGGSEGAPGGAEGAPGGAEGAPGGAEGAPGGLVAGNGPSVRCYLCNPKKKYFKTYSSMMAHNYVDHRAQVRTQMLVFKQAVECW